MAERLSKPRDLEWKKLQGFAGISNFYITHDSFISPSKPFHTTQPTQQAVNSRKRMKENISSSNKANPKGGNVDDHIESTSKIDKLNAVERIDGIVDIVRLSEAARKSTTERSDEVEIPSRLLQEASGKCTLDIPDENKYEVIKISTDQAESRHEHML